MLMRRNGHHPRQNRQLPRWPQWAQAWRDDTNSMPPRAPRPGPMLPPGPVSGCPPSPAAPAPRSAATDHALYHQPASGGRGWGGNR